MKKEIASGSEEARNIEELPHVAAVQDIGTGRIGIAHLNEDLTTKSVVWLSKEGLEGFLQCLRRAMDLNRIDEREVH